MRFSEVSECGQSKTDVNFVGLALQTTCTVLQGACVLATVPLGVYLTFQVCRIYNCMGLWHH